MLSTFLPLPQKAVDLRLSSKKVSANTQNLYLVWRINTNQVTSGSFISMHISPILGSSIVLIPTIIEQIKWGTGGNIKCSLSTSSCVTAVNLS